jgi:CO dehydrogenase maturation factor
MSFTIGFVGKGGTGKSTIASIVTRYIAKKIKKPVLAIDADPNTSLGELLGLEPDETVVGIIDDISSNINNLPAGVTKERLIENRIQQSLGEGEGLDLLVMGRPEGPGCYCFPNSLMRDTITRLQKAYQFIVIDNEAGMEHISRRTDGKIDYLFLVSDHSMHGIRSAQRILRLAEEMKISPGKRHLIINKSREGLADLDEQAKAIGADAIDHVMDSQALSRISSIGRPVAELDENEDIIKKVYKICEGAKWR